MSISSFDVLFCVMYVCVCVFATYCMYRDVHEACQLMDIFVNTENVMLLFLFVSSVSSSVLSPSICFIWLLTALSVSSFLSFPHTVYYLCLVLLLLFFFLSVLLVFCFVSLCLGLPFLPLLVLPHLSPHPAGCRYRKLVDCPQLLDVDDMVKMREPDWKCVYTYLQEFYRGLVTKGLVKTKNSS